MFTLQIQCATIEDAERIIATLKYGVAPAVVSDLASQIPAAPAVSGEPQATEPTPAQQDTKPKNPRGRPRREVAEKPAASGGSETAQTAAAAAGDVRNSETQSSTQQAPTLDDARAALKGVQAKYGTDDMAKPLEILGQFSAGRISEVKPDQYPAFIAACQAA